MGLILMKIKNLSLEIYRDGVYLVDQKTDKGYEVTEVFLTVAAEFLFNHPYEVNIEGKKYMLGVTPADEEALPTFPTAQA